MIDRDARDRLADLFEGYACGTLLDLEPLERLETQLWNCPDQGVAAVLRAHRSIDDPRLEIEYMNENDRIDLLRCASFLRTDSEYEWPEIVFKKSNAGALGLLSGCGAMTLFFVIVVSLEAFLLSFVGTQVIFAVVAIWVQGHLKHRSEVAQFEQHRSEGRELEAWPFLKCSDIPLTAGDLIHDRCRTRFARKV